MRLSGVPDSWRSARSIHPENDELTFTEEPVSLAGPAGTCLRRDPVAPDPQGEGADTTADRFLLFIPRHRRRAPFPRLLHLKKALEASISSSCPAE